MLPNWVRFVVIGGCGPFCDRVFMASKLETACSFQRYWGGRIRSVIVRKGC